MFCTWNYFIQGLKLTIMFTIIGIIRIAQNIYEAVILKCYYLMICEEDRKLESLDNPLKRTRVPPRKLLKIGNEILTPYPWAQTEQSFTANEAAKPGFTVAKSGYQNKVTPKPVRYSTIEIVPLTKLPNRHEKKMTQGGLTANKSLKQSRMSRYILDSEMAYDTMEFGDEEDSAASSLDLVRRTLNIPRSSSATSISSTGKNKSRFTVQNEVDSQSSKSTVVFPPTNRNQGNVEKILEHFSKK